MIRRPQYSFSVISSVLLWILGVVLCFSSCTSRSHLECSVPNGSGDAISLQALSAPAKKGIFTAPDTTAWFGFAGKQLLSEVTGSSGLDSVEVSVTTSVPVDVLLTPLYASDLRSGKKKTTSPSPRNSSLVSGVMGPVSIRMSMISSKTAGDVTGFAVSVFAPGSKKEKGTEHYAKITEIKLCPHKTGWSIGESGYWAGFGASGGQYAYHEKGIVRIDRGQKADFHFSALGRDIATPKNPRRSVFSAGTMTFGWYGSPVPHAAVVYADQLDSLPAEIVPERGTEHLRSLTVDTAGILDSETSVPIPLDPNAIIEWPQEAWRNGEREIFAWDRFPSILIFDVVNYAVQAKYFKRLAFFVEKYGYIGTLVHDRELAAMHGYNAHDYRAESLAAFFDAAEQQSFPLNRYEIELREILLENGIILQNGSRFLPGTGAVLSFSRESNEYLRYLFTAHEGFHGLYFIDAEFRETMHRLYTDVDPRAVNFLETYFSVIDSLQYDVLDRYLMENECMAYTLQQPINLIPRYFGEILTERFVRYGGDRALAEYMESSEAADFVLLADKLQQYIFTRWALGSGRVGLWFSSSD